MITPGGLEARIAWALLWSGTGDVLEAASGVDYGGMLERMDAQELLALMALVQERLQALGREPPGQGQEPVAGKDEGSGLVKLYVDQRYTIRMGARDGPEMPLRPLVKALFVLFLKHPEGILLKERDRYRDELEGIYRTIVPGVSQEDVLRRVARLVDPGDNSFSEKASVLNARLDALLPQEIAGGYKIQGYNGHPRRIPLAELMVEWT